MEMQFQPFPRASAKRPFIIAGPCSAESESQVLETAHALARQGVDLFRSGIWKPRTRPGSFEGVGTIGLPWMRRVKEETGLKVTIEVAKAEHVYEAIKYGIDVFWIGARTTVNPFSVQEVADALKGLDVPVFIKNPINPDINLWTGAIERIYRAGIRQIGLIHRGFSYHGESPFRNVPRWQLAIEIKRRFPDLMLLCDNSHICGRRDTLLPVAQEAMDLSYDGLMTEVHPRPDEAWSDARQQITPPVFRELIDQLVIRQPTTNDAAFLSNLDHLRREIDEIDDEILNLYGRRMQLADEIGQYKKENNIAILQTTRWNEILASVVEKGKAKGLSEQFLGTVLRAVHQESIEHQEAVMNSSSVDFRS